GGLLLFDREQPGPTARGVAVPPEAPPAAPESGASVAESVEPEAEPGRQAALPTESTTAEAESQSGGPAAQAPASSQGEAQMAARPPASAPAEPTPGSGPSAPPVLPSFDVVRVEPSGEAVLAGRAEPRSRVRALDYDDVIGAVTADPQGQWVIVVDEPLAPGTHELGLEAETPSGAVLQSESLVIVTVPYPQVAETPKEAPVAPRQTEPPNAAPALEIPSEVAPEPGPPSTVVAPESGTASQVAAEQRPRVVPRTASPPAAAPAAGSPSEIAPQPAPEDATRVARAGPDRSAAESTPAAPSGTAERVQTRGTRARPAPGGSAERPLAVMVPRSGEGPSRVLQQPSAPSEGLGEGTLVLETIDYAPNGAAYIGGRAAPEARLIVYLNDRPAGYGRADSRGVWLVALDQAIAPGLHDLRVDQVDEDGKVVARVETPFSAAGSVVPKPDEVTVVVQPGNSLWRIARRVYGEGLRYTVIFAANDEQIADPDLIYPGQIFVVPLEE
ncbi:MAG TPA: LysM peptidoglycan-binding domain-containing protein, partial [Kiloniellales bacterium]|nr:LysM peptidoglycan-binding domain-containing protein [Kiloniellales bacterium]